MSTLEFPANPVPNQIYSFGYSTWYWDGEAWNVYPASSIDIKSVTMLNGLSGPVQITAGPNVSVSISGQNIAIGASVGGGGRGASVGGGGGGGLIGGVETLNGLAGNLEITAGENISVTLDELSIRIASSGGAVGVFDGGAPDSDYGGLNDIDAGGVT